jgi:hypothetical protein
MNRYRTRTGRPDGDIICKGCGRLLDGWEMPGGQCLRCDKSHGDMLAELRATMR